MMIISTLNITCIENKLFFLATGNDFGKGSVWFGVSKILTVQGLYS